MPNETLTRRPDPHRSDCWLIYLGDVHVGPRRRHTWSRRAMGMVLGFYPGSKPGEQTHGTAASFDQARADFERAWMMFSARRTKADYEEWREQRDWTAR